MAKKKQQVSKGAKTLGAAGVALAAASYYFFGPSGKKHRKQAHGWMLKMKGEAVHRLESVSDVSESAYNTLMDSIGKEYTQAKAASRAEVLAAIADMKKAWKTIVKENATPAPKKKRARTKSKKA